MRELLQGYRAFVQLDAQDARTVVVYLREVSYAPGDMLFRAGDVQAGAHLLLVLEGEVTVETGTALPGLEFHRRQHQHQREQRCEREARATSRARGCTLG